MREVSLPEQFFYNVLDRSEVSIDDLKPKFEELLEQSSLDKFIAETVLENIVPPEKKGRSTKTETVTVTVKYLPYLYYIKYFIILQEPAEGFIGMLGFTKKKDIKVLRLRGESLEDVRVEPLPKYARSSGKSFKDI